MQTNILWAGREYYSLENCLITTTGHGATIQSTIVGKYEHTIYLLEYKILTNAAWETLFVDIKSRHSDQVMHHQYESDGKGHWTSNGRALEYLQGCIDIDISLTPLTNTLPIKRLSFEKETPQRILVLYFDILEQQVKPVQQQYTQLSYYQYLYENVEDDFNANIELDENGFVLDYPGQFERAEAVEVNYEGMVV